MGELSRPEPVEPVEDWERWGWPWACGGLLVIDVWLTTLGVWWFGMWPP